MYFIKKMPVVYLIFTLLFITACTEKIDTGSLLKDFGGVESVEVLSPTSVQISWNAHSRYREYKVYYNLSEEPIATTSFNSADIKDLSPNTTYTFKVVAAGESGSVGGSKELVATTLPNFTGPTVADLDADGNIIVNWDYPHKIQSFEIFYKSYEDPTSSNTSGWTQINETSVEQKKLLRASVLESSTRYHFMVHVKYLDGTYDRPLKVVKKSTKSGFELPDVSIIDISIGSLPYAIVKPVETTDYILSNYTSRVYKDGVPISDPMVGLGSAGNGNILFSSSANLPLGKTTGLSVHVKYEGGGKNETLIIDDLSTYIKGIPAVSEIPPVTSTGDGVAFMGEALASGDFNCDGASDLAVGLPSASLASMGVKEESAGAVYIYYSHKPSGATNFRLKTTGTPSINPAIPGEDPQVITLEDLSDRAQFGKSLSGNGNLNGDSILGKPCQDLIVGAPGQDVPVSGTDHYGASFVFFGSPQGLKAPSRIKDMQQNVETCNGLVEGASCSAVMLWPNMKLYPASHYVEPSSNYNNAEFGHSVSYIGDFNADGYDDIAIGAPNGDFDGVVDNLLTNDSRYERRTGFVAIYFGSKDGIGFETPTALGIPNSSHPKFRFLKVFSPAPQALGRFGHSVAGGADVDGRFRVRREDAKLVGGGDMIVGAPAERYLAATKSQFKTPGGSANTNGYVPTASLDGGYTTSFGNLGGGNADVGSATGAAYLYFGRANDTAPALNEIEIPNRGNFWSCGSRKVVTSIEHYSCLAETKSVRVLFPRSTYKQADGVALTSRGFGTSVALVGDPSRFDSSNTPLTSPSDSNGDGYAEAVVSASYLTNGTKTNSGGLWVYYGNYQRLYGYNTSVTAGFGEITAVDEAWNNGFSRCLSFAGNPVTLDQKKECAPTLLRSNSIGAQALLGLYPTAMTVGDVTGDGLKDVTVGATGDTTKGTSGGAIFTFSSLLGQGLTSNFLQTYNTNGRSFDYFGRAVAVGNFDGDFSGLTPLNDIMSGAFLDKSTKLGGGAVYGFYSGGQPLSAVNTVPSVQLSDTLASVQNIGYESIRIVGDINRDGRDDAVAKISRPSENSKVYTTDAVVFFGSEIGLVTTEFCKLNLTRVFKTGFQNDPLRCYPSTSPAQGITESGISLPQLITKPTNLSASWAIRAFGVGDVNKDAYGDVAFVDYTGGGVVVVYYGSGGGLQAANNPAWITASGQPQIITRAWAAAGNLDNGSTLYNPAYRDMVYHGDFNNDGASDIVLANPTASSLFRMNVASGFKPGSINAPNPPPADNAGWDCDPSPDSECTSGSAAKYMGNVVIFYGSSTGVQTPKMRGYSSGVAGYTDEPFPKTNLQDFWPSNVVAKSYLIDTYGTEAKLEAEKACSTAGACKAQYLYSPMTVNVSFGYEEMRHLFGSSVATLDVDRDGYTDLVVSAPGWEDIACHYDPETPPTDVRRRDYGKVFIYRGSANGIQAGPTTDYYNATYTAGSCLSDSTFVTEDENALDLTGSSPGGVRALMPPIGRPTLGVNRTGREFGFKVAAAGDVNADGYEDLVVAAPEDTPMAGLNYAGVAYIYYGPLCGADNTVDMWDYLNVNLNKQFSLDSPFFAVSAGPACFRSLAGNTKKPAPMAFYAMDGKDSDRMGTTIMGGRLGKADLNKDGFDDVVLGAPYWDDLINSNNSVGRAVTFFGGTTGLHANDFPDAVVVNSNGVVKPFTITVDTTVPSPAYFEVNASAGDVNGDGTMDIMVPSWRVDGFAPILGVNIGTFFMLY